MKDVIKLSSLSADQIPDQLKVDYYFDFNAHPFVHASLLTDNKSVVEVLGKIGGYAKSWLAKKVEEMSKSAGVRTLTEKDFPGRGTGQFRAIVAQDAVFDPHYFVGAPAGKTPNTICLDRKATLTGSTIYLNEGDIYIGSETLCEPGVGIKGPTIVMERNEVRQGAYLRGNVIIGDNSSGNAFRGELKNVVMLNDANFPHPSYLGDSICGYNTHFGNQVTAANVGIFQGLRERAKRTNIVLDIQGKSYDIGLTKMGVIMGDRTQIGCNSVVAPGTLIGKNCVAYALCIIDRGVYESCTLFKNKPMAKNVIEISKLDPSRV